MTQIGLDRWLEASGFSGNPFASREAGSESESLLNRYFVAPPYFDEVLGDASSPQTALVFAPRGCGKTAQRVMVDYHCRRQLTRGRVLSVLHAEFTPVVEAAGGDLLQITARCHAEEILRRAVVVLSDFLLDSPIAFKVFRQMPEFERVYIRWFISTYADYLTPRHIGALNRGDEVISSSIAHVLAVKEHMPPADLLGDLSGLVHALAGFDAIYVLVDCVDEFALTAADHLAAVALVEPLLADLTVMDLPRVAFKVFLPQELEALIRSRPAIRQDRLLFRRIEWTDEALLEVLRKRLEAFSGHSSLDAVCVPELRGRVEREMVETACGSPRNLIRLAGLLLSEHCKSPMPEREGEWLITEEAWRAAQERFAVEEAAKQPSNYLNAALASRKPISVEDLIERGEGEQLEFKSTMCWDFQQGKSSRILKKTVAKALSGFMNREGGILLIGVDDSGNVLGLDQDFSALPKQDRDGFQLTLMTIVKHHLGMVYCEYIHPRFIEVEGKTICVVEVDRSPEPVYLHDGENREFYVRMGNSTRPMNVEEAIRYIHLHWDSS